MDSQKQKQERPTRQQWEIHRCILPPSSSSSQKQSKQRQQQSTAIVTPIELSDAEEEGEEEEKEEQQQEEGEDVETKDETSRVEQRQQSLIPLGLDRSTLACPFCASNTKSPLFLSIAAPSVHVYLSNNSNSASAPTLEPESKVARNVPLRIVLTRNPVKCVRDYRLPRPKATAATSSSSSSSSATVTPALTNVTNTPSSSSSHQHHHSIYNGEPGWELVLATGPLPAGQSSRFLQHLRANSRTAPRRIAMNVQMAQTANPPLPLYSSNMRFVKDMLALAKTKKSVVVDRKRAL